MSYITRELADFAAGIDYHSLPPAVAERAKWLLMDAVGIALRARQESPATPSLLAAVDKLGLAQGAARQGVGSVIGDAAGYAPPAAAWVNGALAHALDFDDTHARGSIHPSAPIIPAALAAAEMAGRGGRELLAAVVAGYEVQIRLSLALVPKDHYDRGFHPTATCGAFGATAAAARLFDLAPEQVASAFGICLSQTAGTMQFLHDGAWTKLFQVGYAAMNGLIAATLAAAGFKGAGQAIEGKAGFLHAYAPQPQPERAVADLGEVFETLNIAVKPYPSCRYSHAALDAVIALRAEHAIASEEVEGVEIGLPRTGWHLIGDPLAAKQRPQNIVDGQFSMPFLAAVALRTGRLGWDDYPIYLKDRHVLSLCQRITAIIDPQAEAEFPANMSAVVRIRTPRGRFERFVKAPKGEPDNFITLDELRAKFASLVGPYLGAAREHRLAVALLTLEQASSLRELMVLTRPQESTGRHAAAAGD